ncbi:MAG: hypothetical protein HYX68_20900 [Planctomycetes bacterium]|nr:hypothetical protein [Planctomycetota bacterium]
MTVWQKSSPGTNVAPVPPGVATGLERAASFSWEDWFGHASAPQRADAIGLAHRQGVLYPHQLPPVSNGVKPAQAPPAETAALAAMTRILAEKPGELPTPEGEALPFFDLELDDLQRQAVARAIATPDLFLLQGLPGTGKSRVVAEILRQTARLRRRVLFLATHPASIDVVLQRLIDHEDALAIRFLDSSEKTEHLPPWLQRLTLGSQERMFLERTLAGARANFERADSTCQQQSEREPLWRELQNCLNSATALNRQAEELNTQISNLRPSVEADLGAGNHDSDLARRLANAKATSDLAEARLVAELHGHQKELAQAEKECAELASHVALLTPAYLAKKHGRFWTLAFWINLFNGKLILETEGLLAKQPDATARCQQIAGLVECKTAELNQIRHAFAKERAELVECEVRARTQVFQQQSRALEAEKQKLDEAWHTLCLRLNTGPIEKTLAAVEQAQKRWREAKSADERLCQFANQWRHFVEESGALLTSRLPGYANILAGTIRQWTADPKFRKAADAPVDLLIVEDAEQLAEDELLRLAAAAHRCVLVGRTIADPLPAAAAPEKNSRISRPGSPAKSLPCWNRLWKATGRELNRWPGAWKRDNGRLVCQLFPLTGDDVQHLESESLVGAPDIELCILHRPSSQPCLAQVIFAPDCSFGDAVAFMVREVQEFPVQTQGLTVWWSDDGRYQVCHLGPRTGRIHSWIEIEPGVRLGVTATECAVSGVAQCIEFDHAGSWDRAAAHAWLRRHLALVDTERKVFLQTPFRFDGALAKIVQGVIQPGDWVASPAPATAGSFLFIAVPASTGNGQAHAAYELDLSASRSSEALPAGLRHGLPGRGYVNYAEAQALIGKLEGWAREHPSTKDRVAVVALYAGQVELLRRLVTQSELLRSCTFPLEIALPSALHQREFEFVLLSMTRSNPQRTVAFGENVREFPLGLTLACSRLYVFGDARTLSQRVSSKGPVENLKSPDLEIETRHLSRFAACLQDASIVLPVGQARTNGKD